MFRVLQLLARHSSIGAFYRSYPARHIQHWSLYAQCLNVISRGPTRPPEVIDPAMTSTLTDDDWCEINSKAINRMYETLTRDIDCTKYFPSLRSAFILTADDCDEIRHEGTRKKMVMKFLDLLDRNKKPTVVEELLKAIRKDKTMPQLHTKLVRTFVDTKEQYKRETSELSVCRGSVCSMIDFLKVQWHCMLKVLQYTW